MSQMVEGTDTHLRLRVTRLVTRDVSAWVEDDDASLDLVVEDVLGHWSELNPHADDPADLARFWNQYANRVEFDEPDTGDDFRVEFCPAKPGLMDTDDYYRAVWKAHVADLRSAATGPAVA